MKSSLFKIELKSVYLTWKISNITYSVWVAIKVYIVHKYGMYTNKYPESVQICNLFFIRVCKTGHLIQYELKMCPSIRLN